MATFRLVPPGPRATPIEASFWGNDLAACREKLELWIAGEGWSNEEVSWRFIEATACGRPVIVGGVNAI